MIDMKITGGKELHALLQQLPVQVETKILRNALARGVNIIRDEARRLAPSETGKLRRAIKTTRDTDRKSGRVIAKVKVKGEHSFLAVFHEYGVAQHLITAGDSELTPRTLNKRGRRGGLTALSNGLVKVGGYEYEQRYHTKDGVEVRMLKIGNSFIGGSVLHPGYAAKPFLRPALDNKAAEAINAIGEYIGSYLKFGTIQAPTISVDEEDV